jgi:ketopantoate reductase
MGSQRIAVVGVGAIGGAVAADLADLGRHDISLCSRTPFRRLVVEHPGGVSCVDGGVRTSPTEAGVAEWEVRNAVVCRYGRRHGIATPLNDAMTALLKAADRRGPAASVGADPSASTRA